MSIKDVAEFAQSVRDSGLLEEDQLRDLGSLSASAAAEPQVLAAELVRRGWLTPYQADQLLKGNGKSLVLGQYTLLERLGEGGMGQVFKARHRLMKRVVALKIIHPDWLSHRNAVHRFHREIQAVAQLSHPNMVTAHDANQVDNTHFLVMEYVDGVDLSTLVHKLGPLPVSDACTYIRQAAEGLQHAYERGLVHRDIKPSNLLVTREAPAGSSTEANRRPTVKILDMGLARLRAAEEEEEASSTTALTAEGAVMGTADYISPEQATNAHRVDIRSDLYSLGCTFYFLLTGEPPYPGGNFMEKVFKHKLETPRSVRAAREDVPPEVAVVCLKLMAKRPEDRYQTPAELVAALAPFCEAAPHPSILQSLLPGNGAALLEIAAARATPAPERIGETRVGAATPAGGVDGVDSDFLTGEAPAPARPPGATVRDAAAHPASVRKPAAGVPLNDATLPHVPAVDHSVTQPMAAAVAPAAPAPLPRGRGRWAAALVFLGLLLAGGVGLALFFPRDQGNDPEARGKPPDEGPIKPGPIETPKDREKPRDKDRMPLKDGPGPITKPIEKLPEFHGPPLPPVQSVGVLYRLSGRHPVSSAVFATDGSSVLVCLHDAVALYDLKKVRDDSKPMMPVYRYQHRQELADRPPLQVALAPGGRRVLFGTRDLVREAGQLRPATPILALWQTDGDDEPLVFHGPRSAILSVAVTAATPPRALSGMQDNTVCLWELDRPEKPSVRYLIKHTDVVDAVAFSPDGRRALSASRDKTICLWNVEDAQHLHTFQGHERWVTCIAFSPNGEAALSGSEDRTARLWSLREPQKPALVLTGHTGPVLCVAFSPDGRYALTGGEDATVRYWALDTGRPVSTVKHDSAILAVGFSPDGRYGVSVDKDQTIRRWELPE